MVQQRAAHLKRSRHTGAIDLCQDIVSQRPRRLSRKVMRGRSTPSSQDRKYPGPDRRTRWRWWRTQQCAGIEYLRHHQFLEPLRVAVRQQLVQQNQAASQPVAAQTPEHRMQTAREAAGQQADRRRQGGTSRQPALEPRIAFIAGEQFIPAVAGKEPRSRPAAAIRESSTVGTVEVSANGSSHSLGRSRRTRRRMRRRDVEFHVCRVPRCSARRRTQNFASSQRFPGKPIAKLRTASVEHCVIIAVTRLESIPPERNAPTGTSAVMRRATPGIAKQGVEFLHTGRPAGVLVVETRDRDIVKPPRYATGSRGHSAAPAQA